MNLKEKTNSSDDLPVESKGRVLLTRDGSNRMVNSDGSEGRATGEMLKVATNVERMHSRRLDAPIARSIVRFIKCIKSKILL